MSKQATTKECTELFSRCTQLCHQLAMPGSTLRIDPLALTSGSIHEHGIIHHFLLMRFSGPIHRFITKKHPTLLQHVPHDVRFEAETVESMSSICRYAPSIQSITLDPDPIIRITSFLSSTYPRLGVSFTTEQFRQSTPAEKARITADLVVGFRDWHNWLVRSVHVSQSAESGSSVITQSQFKYLSRQNEARFKTPVNEPHRYVRSSPSLESPESYVSFDSSSSVEISDDDNDDDDDDDDDTEWNRLVESLEKRFVEECFAHNGSMFDASLNVSSFTSARIKAMSHSYFCCY